LKLLNITKMELVEAKPATPLPSEQGIKFSFVTWVMVNIIIF